MWEPRKPHILRDRLCSIGFSSYRLSHHVFVLMKLVRFNGRRKHLNEARIKLPLWTCFIFFCDKNGLFSFYPILFLYFQICFVLSYAQSFFLIWWDFSVYMTLVLESIYTFRRTIHIEYFQKTLIGLTNQNRFVWNFLGTIEESMKM